jgi:ParB-like chromosome segregation protein Spo0J
MDLIEIEDDVRLDPHSIHPLHGVRDADKLARLTDAMRAHGWVGRSLLVWTHDGESYQAVTGSHRLAAAKEIDLEVPCTTIRVDGWHDEASDLVDELNAAHDQDEAWRILTERAGETDLSPVRDALDAEDDANLAEYEAAS